MARFSTACDSCLGLGGIPAQAPHFCGLSRYSAAPKRYGRVGAVEGSPLGISLKRPLETQTASPVVGRVFNARRFEQPAGMGADRSGRRDELLRPPRLAAPPPKPATPTRRQAEGLAPRSDPDAGTRHPATTAPIHRTTQGRRFGPEARSRAPGQSSYGHPVCEQPPNPPPDADAVRAPQTPDPSP